MCSVVRSAPTFSRTATRQMEGHNCRAVTSLCPPQTSQSPSTGVLQLEICRSIPGNLTLMCSPTLQLASPSLLLLVRHLYK